MKQLISLISILTMSLIISSLVSAKTLSTEDYLDYEKNVSWSIPMIWAVGEGIVSGYPNEKNLKPYEYLTEAQLTKMLLHLLLDPVELEKLSNNSQSVQHWSIPYYQLAKDYKISLSYNNLNKRNQPIRRGTVALIIAESITGKDLLEREAVEWMYKNGISNGFSKQKKTYESFHPNDTLNRSQAVVFLYNVEKNIKDKALKVIERKANEITFNKFELGDTQKEIEQIYGAAKRITLNADGLKMNTYYHNDYEDFLIVGYDNQNRAAFFYSNQPIITSARLENIELNDRKTITSYFNIDSSSVITDVTLDDSTITFFYDTLSKEFPVRAIQMKQNNWNVNNSTTNFETNDYLIYDITNSYRKVFGQKTLKWDNQVAKTALNHSIHMFKNNFLSHNNKNGQDLFDRLSTDGHKYKYAGENIAYGFTNGISVIEAWMNSTGHRETIIKSNYTHLGVGSHYSYYTQNFLTPQK